VNKTGTEVERCGMAISAGIAEFLNASLSGGRCSKGDRHGSQRSADGRTARCAIRCDVAAVGERDWVVREDGGRELGHYSTR
jgi:hypothetical protein